MMRVVVRWIERAEDGVGLVLCVTYLDGDQWVAMGNEMGLWGLCERGWKFQRMGYEWNVRVEIQMTYKAYRIERPLFKSC